MEHFQAVGKVAVLVESICVKELGATLSKDEIFRVLELDIMEGAIEVDWRDFFPYLRWVPNKSVEMKIQRLYSRRQSLMNALIGEAKQRITSGQVFFTCLKSVFYSSFLKFWKN